ncbi:cobalt-precorrin-6A reductase [Epibacterium ulvae]|uniref:cobalt-precorrin-6A reductase n=1 Tax=Epibacterium ulvae TaxID=1156985 RepID=UPI001BFC7D1B|nr:cobalt-precorrin-6A reductase [Epibacterium ulvae]MBT8154348.1 cobalt-precorrin-6A reductase [Epibacterium ulvae]
MTQVLLLGGTTEASQLARALAEGWVGAGRRAVFSYAGRTARPASQPLPLRLGGFGGVAGLVDYIRAEGITHVIDVTHPFAAQMSNNAVAACANVGVPLVALQRPAWVAGDGDNWHHVGDIAAAVDALPHQGARVFLAIGKQTLAPFAIKPANHYLLRLIDPPEGQLPLPNTTVIVARGPFETAGDQALLAAHGITHVVAKNAGGTGAAAKLAAARALGLPVIMIDRPQFRERPMCASVAEVMTWLTAHSA